jgi:hypothetical protein
MNNINEHRSIVIKIKNISEDKFYNVNVFNHKFENLFGIHYSSLTPNISYEQICQELLSYKKSKFIIRQIRHHVLCDYLRFRQRQVICGIELIEASLRDYKRFSIDPYQFQSDTCEIKNLELPYIHSSNIIYEFLMPETEIHLVLSLTPVTLDNTQ